MREPIYPARQQLEALFMDLLNLKADSVTYKAFAKSKKGEKDAAMHKIFNDPESVKLLKLTAKQEAKIAAWVPNCF